MENILHFLKTIMRFSKSGFSKAIVAFIIMQSMTAYSQDVNIKFNLSVKDASLKTIFESMRKQSKFDFIYSDDEIKNFKATVNLKGTPINETMQTVLKNLPFTYEIKDNVIVVILPKVAKTSQVVNVTVSGKVIDENNAPIVGATLIVVGTKSGGISDDKGAFSFTAKQGDVIEVNYLGTNPLKYVIKGNESNLVLKMTPNALAVDDVVVTGIYTRKADSFTGSAKTYTVKDLKSVGNTNILQSLKSLDPALNVTSNNQFGSDPNRTPDMEIRGKSSIVGSASQFGEDPNQPLFILDGFETTLSVIMDLSLDRVATVTILKDAASTAIYGAKAANGVVVVETKAPVAGKLRFTYNGNAAFQFADLSDYNLMNSREKLEFERHAGNFTSNNQLSQEELNKRYYKLNNEVNRGVDTYWLSEPLRVGLNHRHTIYVEGGDSQVRYGIGLNYNGNNGVMKQSKRDVMGGNIDLIYRVGKFSFTNKLSVEYRVSDNPIVAFSEFSRTNPYYRKTNTYGGIDKLLETNVVDQVNGASYKPSLFEVGNPMWNYVQKSYNNEYETIIRDNINIEYRPIDAFSLRARMGISKSNLQKEDFTAPEATKFNRVEPNRKGSYSSLRSDGFNYESELTATYGKVFGKKHLLNAVLGAKLNDNSSASDSYQSEGFPEGGYIIPSFSTSYTIGKPSYSDYQKRGVNLYFNSGYVFDDRFLIDFTYRLDGSSVFGASKRFTDTWSTGLAWNIHNENFIKNLNLFQTLKLRGSIGNPGNQNFGSFQTISTYSFNTNSTSIFGPSVNILKFGDDDLPWQKTMTKTIGIDVVLLGNRLSLTADYYHKLTDPQLANVGIPSSTGMTSRLMAVGQSINRGYDATLRYFPIYKPAQQLTWMLSLTTRHTYGFYDKIGSSLNEQNRRNLYNSTTRYYNKVSSSAIWAVRSAGIDPATGKEIFITKDDNVYTFDYVIQDEVEIGDTNPDFEGSLRTAFHYKGFTLDLSLRYSFGADALNNSLYNKVENISVEGLKQNQDKRALYDRWQKPGDVAKFKRIDVNTTTPISSRFLMPNNYLSLESVRLNYEFNSAMTSKAGISGLTLSAYMNDIARWSTMKDERGIDYPFARSISVSLSFNF